jgi:hypothetical protein
MFNPPQHKVRKTKYGETTRMVNQSKERVQMLNMLSKFTLKLKVSRASSVDEVRFREEDFGREVPENIEFYN